MNYCACKGIRTCLICERRKNIGKELAEDVMSRDSYYCCMRCGKLVRSIDVSFTTEDNNTSVCDPPCNGESDTIVVEDQVISPDVKFGGIFLYKNFVSPEEEAGLVSDIDSAHWVDSQSGRRKQDFGPKVNFKKQKIQLDTFQGLPDYIRPIIDKINHLVIGGTPFIPVEQCNLEYEPGRGSSIDPHLDDSWLWGERLATINLSSSTFLTFTHPTNSISIHIPLLKGSLLVVRGLARYIWKHSVLRENVKSRRLAITLRELSPEFSHGGAHEYIGQQLLSRATSLFEHQLLYIEHQKKKFKKLIT